MSNYPEGVDLYSGDGVVDFAAAKAAGISFVVVKRSQGLSYVNPQAAQQVAGARAQGLIVGHYHFYDLAMGNPVQQADHYCDTVGPFIPGDLPPFVDLEAPADANESIPIDPPSFIAQYHAYIDHVEQRTGRKVVIYTYPSYWRDSLGNPSDWAQTNPLWLASYGTPTPPAYLVGQWTSTLFHQYDDHGRVPGVRGGTGDVDRDRFVGTIDQLKVLAGMVPPAATNRYFPAPIDQYISHGFKDAWEALERIPATDGISPNIAMQCVGYPISGERQETIGTWSGTVQYFERSRLEYHDGKILFGHVGAEVLAGK